MVPSLCKRLSALVDDKYNSFLYHKPTIETRASKPSLTDSCNKLCRGSHYIRRPTE